MYRTFVPELAYSEARRRAKQYGREYVVAKDLRTKYQMFAVLTAGQFTRSEHFIEVRRVGDGR